MQQRIAGWPRWVRLVVGVLLVLGGMLGFLPLLGVWMIPLGLFVLSIDIPAVRRLRRRLETWWTRRQQQRRKTPQPQDGETRQELPGGGRDERGVREDHPSI